MLWGWGWPSHWNEYEELSGLSHYQLYILLTPDWPVLWSLRPVIKLNKNTRPAQQATGEAFNGSRQSVSLRRTYRLVGFHWRIIKNTDPGKVLMRLRRGRITVHRPGCCSVLWHGADLWLDLRQVRHGLALCQHSALCGPMSLSLSTPLSVPALTGRLHSLSVCHSLPQLLSCPGISPPLLDYWHSSNTISPGLLDYWHWHSSNTISHGLVDD